MGHEVEIARDGVEGIAAAGRFSPDLILLDLGLPDMNGLEVCRRIREQEWGRQVVVVALTGWGQDEDRQASRDAGFDGHVVKPAAPDVLMGLVDSLSPKPA